MAGGGVAPIQSKLGTLGLFQPFDFLTLGLLDFGILDFGTFGVLDFGILIPYPRFPRCYEMDRRGCSTPDLQIFKNPKSENPKYIETCLSMGTGSAFKK